MSFPKLHEPVIKKNLEQAYEGYKNKMDFFEEVQSTRKSKKFLAYLILLRRKYKHLSEDQSISDPRDALFINEAYERLNWFCNEALSFYREHPEYQTVGYWGHQTPIRWGIGIVINPKYIRGHKGVMPNEYMISDGNPREQILGIFLRGFSPDFSEERER